ncbi:peptidylprolyl isomerase [Marinobacter caseinilyticus]|uniref:peptidylprolyl isomerase n=1 Tax=Marinobacter caseinilyticus TaxID=2692195 RepID=UPI0014086C61
MTNLILAGLVSLLFTSSAIADNTTPVTDASLPKVAILTTEGEMELLLRPDLAPETVKNFLAYVDAGFYDGTVFHRVIPGFMIQGGGYDRRLSKKQTGAPVKNEAKPTAKNLRGSVAMARTSDPDSATSQFFINIVDNAFLNAGVRGPGYTVFGKISAGMGVVDAIANQATTRQKGMADVPVESVVIKSIRRLDE